MSHTCDLQPSHAIYVQLSIDYTTLLAWLHRTRSELGRDEIGDGAREQHGTNRVPGGLHGAPRILVDSLVVLGSIL